MLRNILVEKGPVDTPTLPSPFKGRVWEGVKKGNSYTVKSLEENKQDVQNVTGRGSHRRNTRRVY
jgi:hypothetical protein